MRYQDHLLNHGVGDVPQNFKVNRLTGRVVVFDKRQLSLNIAHFPKCFL